MNTNRGKLFIISAPSGAGKSTLIQKLLSEEIGKNFYMSVSHTTRAPRVGEQDGVHYHYVTKEEFQKAIENNELLEWAEVHGNYYGTSAKVINQKLDEGLNVILDIDWVGAQNVRKLYPEAISIFVTPPSAQVIYERLINRATDSAQTIERRMKDFEIFMSHKDEYTYTLLNDNFDTCYQEFKKILTA